MCAQASEPVNMTWRDKYDMAALDFMTWAKGNEQDPAFGFLQALKQAADYMRQQLENPGPRRFPLSRSDRVHLENIANGAQEAFVKAWDKQQKRDEAIKKKSINVGKQRGPSPSPPSGGSAKKMKGSAN